MSYKPFSFTGTKCSDATVTGNVVQNNSATEIVTGYCHIGSLDEGKYYLEVQADSSDNASTSEALYVGIVCYSEIADSLCTDSPADFTDYCELDFDGGYIDYGGEIYNEDEEATRLPNVTDYNDTVCIAIEVTSDGTFNIWSSINSDVDKSGHPNFSSSQGSQDDWALYFYTDPELTSSDWAKITVKSGGSSSLSYTPPTDFDNDIGEQYDGVLLGDMPSLTGEIASVLICNVGGDFQKLTGNMSTYVLENTAYFVKGDLPSLTGNLGTVRLNGVLPGLTGEITGNQNYGILNGELKGLQGSLATGASISGELYCITGGIVQSTTVNNNLIGELPSLDGGMEVHTNTIASELPSITGSAYGESWEFCSVVGELPSLIGGSLSVRPIIDGSFKALTGTLHIVKTDHCWLTGKTPGLSGTLSVGGTITGTLSKLDGTCSLLVGNRAKIEGSIPVLKGTADIIVDSSASVTGTFRKLGGKVTGTLIKGWDIEGTLPSLSGELTRGGILSSSFKGIDGDVSTAGKIKSLTCTLRELEGNITEGAILTASFPSIEGIVSSLPTAHVKGKYGNLQGSLVAKTFTASLAGELPTLEGRITTEYRCTVSGEFPTLIGTSNASYALAVLDGKMPGVTGISSLINGAIAESEGEFPRMNGLLSTEGVVPTVTAHLVYRRCYCEYQL